MKQKRISFDVPEEIHTYLKINCAKSHVALRDLMQEITMKTVAELKKKEFHDSLTEAFHRSYKGEGHKLTDEDMARWEKELDES